MRLSHDGHTAVFLSVYPPPPSRHNKLTNAMFLEQFSDLLELSVSCDGLFVVGDLNVHLDKPSHPSTSAPNVGLDNLSLHQLIKVSTPRHGYPLDWLTTNHATNILDLTVVDMLLLSDHFVSEKKNIISQNIRVTDMHVLGQMFIIYLGQPLSLTQLIPSVIITNVYASYLTVMPLFLYVL